VAAGVVVVVAVLLPLPPPPPQAATRTIRIRKMLRRLLYGGMSVDSPIMAEF
jgi:hypothetical protein